MIRKLIASVALFAVIGLCLASVPSIKISRVTEKIQIYPMGAYYFMDAADDFIALSTFNGDTFPISVRRRGSDGMYTNETNLLENEFHFPVTNGEWIAVINDVTDNILNFYKVGDNTLVQSVPAQYYSHMSFFPGNVLVCEYYSDPIVWEIFTYTDSWSHSSTITLGDQNSVGNNFGLSDDRKYVITANDTMYNIRQFSPADKTFTLVEEFPFNSTYFTIAIYNGLDTVVAASAYTIGDTVFGGAQVYTKANGVWSATQTFTAVDLGLRASGVLGTAGVFINDDTFALAASAENGGTPPSAPSGKVIIMTRGLDGMWTQAYQLEVDSADNVAFGLNTVVNSRKELIIPGFGNDGYGYIYSTCLTTPIDITCNSITEPTDCNNVNMSSLYTINSPPACGKINATVVSSTNTDNQMKVEFSFTKLGAKSASCTSTVTCQTAPVATPMASTPVKGPSGKKASSATVIEFAGAVVLAITLTL